MVSRIQIQAVGQMAVDGWVSISAPYSEKSPVGGPTMMINDVHDVCWVMADGKVFTMTKNEQSEFRNSKEGEIVLEDDEPTIEDTEPTPQTLEDTEPTPPPGRTLKETDVPPVPPVMLGLGECLVVLQSHKTVKKNPTTVAVLQQIHRESENGIPNKADIKVLWDIAKPSLTNKNIKTIVARAEALLFG